MAVDLVRESPTLDAVANPTPQGTGARDEWTGLPPDFLTRHDAQRVGESGVLPAHQQQRPATGAGGAPVVDIPDAPRLWPVLDRFERLVLWKGRVLGVGRESFTAELVDQNEPQRREFTEIPTREVSDDDVGLIAEGSTFYWAIGYNVNHARRRDRKSVIRFQRLPRWSTEEIEQARLKAEHYRPDVDRG